MREEETLMRKEQMAQRTIIKGKKKNKETIKTTFGEKRIGEEREKLDKRRVDKRETYY